MSLWIGGMVASVWTYRRWGPACCLGVGAWYIAGAFYSFPNFISYFNELTGGPSNGYHYAVDCNLDWGQGLKALARYLHEKNVRTIYFSYFGSADPHAYGIRYVPVASVSIIPLAGDSPDALAKETRILFAISATNRVGLYYKNHHLFDWLDQRQQLDTVANAILIYDITGDRDALDHIAWVRRALPPGTSVL